MSQIVTGVSTTTVTKKLNIYPVPSSGGSVNIIANTAMAGATATAYDITGKKVQQWKITGGLNSYQFNWQPGVYMLEFIKGPIKEVKKIVISR